MRNRKSYFTAPEGIEAEFETLQLQPLAQAFFRTKTGHRQSCCSALSRRIYSQPYFTVADVVANKSTTKLNIGSMKDLTGKPLSLISKPVKCWGQISAIIKNSTLS